MVCSSAALKTQSWGANCRRGPRSQIDADRPQEHTVVGGGGGEESAVVSIANVLGDVGRQTRASSGASLFGFKETSGASLVGFKGRGRLSHTWSHEPWASVRHEPWASVLWKS